MLPRFLCAYPAANLYPDAFASHLNEMAGLGFDTVVLCVPEHYIQHSLPIVRELIRLTRSAGLQCWVDPWAVAGVFDGEAPHAAGGKPEATIAWWIDALGRAPQDCRPDAVFWDNPRPAEVHRIAVWGARARGFGMRSHVCLSADRHKGDLGLFRRVAGLDVVDGVFTDPYVLCPDRAADYPIEDYVAGWARALAEIAEETGTLAGCWVQGFGLPAGCETIPVRAAQAAMRQGIGAVGFWAFRSCAGWVNAPERPREVWDEFGRWMQRAVAGPGE
jgi:hypothetical protein